MIKLRMIHHVNSLPLVKLSFNVKKSLVHSLPLTDFKNQEKIFFIFYVV